MISRNWEKAELLPAIVQDSESGQVLMLGYMNKESFSQTLDTGRVTFFSRSRESIWVKGETSGNYLSVVEILSDCDQDAILVKARPEGPTCHRGSTSCFTAGISETFLGELEATIRNRMAEQQEESYVASLVKKGIDRIIQKVGEESIETVIAAKNSDLEKLESEAADLLFHLTLLLQVRGSSLQAVTGVLEQRHRAKRSSRTFPNT